MKLMLYLLTFSSLLLKAEELEELKNPLSILDYGDFQDITWYGWFVIFYSLFVVIIVGSAIFLP